MTVLIVEDNAAIAGLLASHLNVRGIATAHAASAAEALRLALPAPDAILLDLGLPDMDGLVLLARLRALSTAPILIVTARDAVPQRIAGLDAGADDYILKPFDLGELEARLRAVLRRPGARSGETSFAGLTLNMQERRLAAAGGAAQELTPREATLMAALIAARGRVVVRDALAEQLYGAVDEVSANALEATVSRLRRKLTALAATPTLETVRGIGYRLRADGAV